LIQLAQELSQSLPAIAKGVATLNQDITTQLGGMASQQQRTEINIRDDLKTVQTLLTHVQDTQVLIERLSQSSITTQNQQHIQLQKIVKSVESFSRTQQEVLRQREAEALQQHIDNGGGGGYLSTILRFVSNGIAGAIGGIIVLHGSRASECQKKHADGESETPKRHHNTKVRDTGNKKVVGGTILGRVNENEQTRESVLSDQHTNTGQEATSELSPDGRAASQYTSTNQGITSSDCSSNRQSTAESMHINQKSTFYDSLINNRTNSLSAHKSQSSTSPEATDARQSDSRSRGYSWSTPNTHMAELVLSSLQADNRSTYSRPEPRDGYLASTSSCFYRFSSKDRRGKEWGWVCCYCCDFQIEIVFVVCPTCSHDRCSNCIDCSEML
jgi:hypothetical protein